MMRELKAVAGAQPPQNQLSAAAQIPMMRELKGWTDPKAALARHQGCSPNPYDEGTERKICLEYGYDFPTAAAQIPMMRELKAGSVKWIKCIGGAAAQIPMMRELKAPAG